MQVLSMRLPANAGLVLIPVYLFITLLIGWLSRRRASGSNDFLNATGSQPFWIVAAAFFSSNCGALEIIGLSAVAAQYGVQAFHFYWIGAIPSMIILSALMMPIYMRSGVRSLPEYLERRYSPRLRLINAWLILLTVLAVSGISVYAMAQVLHVVFRWPFAGGAWIAAIVVLIYVLLGGLRATLYNEVFQLLIIVVGLLPLALRIHPASGESVLPSDSHWHLWAGLPVFSTTAPLDLFGVLIGLAFVLSTNYWCTDFVQIQRALTARTLDEGRMVPLIAGFGKLGFSLLVVLPALAAIDVLGARRPLSYDQTLPALMAATYGPQLLSLGLTALLASLMSGLAANVSAFASLWTEEIYRVSWRTRATEEHYVRVSRAAIFAAVLLSVAASYLSFFFRDLMELVQMVFSLFGAPFLAVLLAGFFSRRATTAGATVGLICGVSTASLFHLLVFINYFPYGSQMSANFHSAACAFSVSLVICLLFSRSGDRKSAAQLQNLVYEGRAVRQLLPASPTWWVLAFTLIAACVVLNYFWY
jgi:SSS family solute:Na+ symporter